MQFDEFFERHLTNQSGNQSVIVQRNLLIAKTRKKVLDDLNEAAYKVEDSEMEKLRKKAIERCNLTSFFERHLSNQSGNQSVIL